MNTIILSYDNLNTLYKKYRTDFTPFKGETKESYLEWRKQWKATYAQLTLDIRSLKYYRKMDDRRTDVERENATMFARMLKHVATYALEYRIESKVTAETNYLKMKEVEAV